MHFTPDTLTAVFFVCLVFLLALRARALSPGALWRCGLALWLLLLLLELCKQLLALSRGSYTTALLPFHYSSTFYLTMLLSLLPRTSHFGSCTTFVGGFFLLLATLGAPRAVLGDTALALTDFAHFHALFYHVGVLLFFAVLCTTARYRPQRGDAWRYLAFLLSWGAVALPAARRTGNNYAGLLRSYIPVLERVRLRYGDGVYLFLYALLAQLLACLLLRGLTLAHRTRLTRALK